MEILENTLFYNAMDFPSVRIQTKKLDRVSKIFGIDVTQEILGSDYLNVLPERIEFLERLKIQAIEYLKNNRKKEKNADKCESCDLALVNKYLSFLNQIIHYNYQLLIRENRVKRRKTSVDLKSIFQVSENVKKLSIRMLEEEISPLDIEDSPKDVIMALAYLLKKTSFDNSNSIFPMKKISEYVDSIYLYLLDSPLTYQRCFEQTRLLHDVVKYRKLSVRDLNLDDLEKEKVTIFLIDILKKIDRLDNYQIKYEEVVIDSFIDDKEKYYHFFMNLVKKSNDIVKVNECLTNDADLLYLASDNCDNKYFWVELFDEYSNMLINSRISNEKFGYYQELMETYIKEIVRQNDENMKLLLYKKISRLLTNINKCEFELDRKDVSYQLVNSLLEKLQGFEEKDVYQAINQLNHYDLSRRDSDNSYIFTISDSDNYYFEQAFSYQKKKTFSEIVFYVTDVMKNRPTTDVSLQEMFWKIDRGDNFFNRKAKDTLSLVKDKDCYAVGYHFLLDEQCNVVDIEVKKEKIRVNDNFSYEDMDLILSNQNSLLYSQIQPFYATISSILFGHDNGLYVNEGSVSQKIYEKSLQFLNQRLAQYAISNNYPLVGVIENNDNNELNAFDINLYTTDTRDREVTIVGSYASPSSSIVDYINQIILCRYSDSNNNISYREDWNLRMSLRRIASKLNLKHHEEIKVKQKKKQYSDNF